MLRLKELRNHMQLPQKDVCASLEIPQNTYSQYENGKREPDTETLSRIADFFNVSVDYLLGRTDDKNQKPGEENIKFDDFTYAMHNETQDLTEDDKQMLIDMARMLKNRINEKKALENPQK